MAPIDPTERRARLVREALRKAAPIDASPMITENLRYIATFAEDETLAFLGRLLKG